VRHCGVLTKIFVFFLVAAWQSERRADLGHGPAGREARQVTNLKDETILSCDWAPDAKRLLLVLREKDESDEDEKPKPPKPIVIDRYQFKEDVDGYLTDKRPHIY
jgi:hypothetical protein